MLEVKTMIEEATTASKDTEIKPVRQYRSKIKKV